MTADVIAFRQRKPDRRSEVADLELEIAALTQQNQQLGAYLGWVSRMLQRAALTDRADIVMEAAGRLDHMAGRLLRQTENAA